MARTILLLSFVGVCALGTGCEYDGGSHTPPVVKMSAVLVAYQATGV